MRYSMLAPKFAPRGGRSCGAVRISANPRLELVSTLARDLGRALAAARCYENLKYGRACRAGLASSDIARRVFEEFYSDGGDTFDDALAPGRASSPRPS